MALVGIFFGSSSYGTQIVAEKIQSALGADMAAIHNIRRSTPEEILAYDYLVLGTSTWGDGSIQPDWNEFLPRLRQLDLSHKHVALFGLGDQETYPETFAQGLGTLYDAVREAGAGAEPGWPTEGYSFTQSSAVREGRFVGLVIDKINQAPLTNERIARWVADLRAAWHL